MSIIYTSTRNFLTPTASPQILTIPKKLCKTLQKYSHGSTILPNNLLISCIALNDSHFSSNARVFSEEITNFMKSVKVHSYSFLRKKCTPDIFWCEFWFAKIYPGYTLVGGYCFLLHLCTLAILFV